MFVTVIIGATLLFLTGLFYYTPSCVLSAIVIAAAISLVDFQEPRYLLRIREFTDLFAYCAVVLVTLLLGPGTFLLVFHP